MRPPTLPPTAAWAGNPPFRRLTPSTLSPAKAEGGAIFIGPDCEVHLQDATFTGNQAPPHPDAHSNSLCAPRGAACQSKGPNIYHRGGCGYFGHIYVYPGCNIAASSSGTDDQ